jgi:hypothetical protein
MGFFCEKRGRSKIGVSVDGEPVGFALGNATTQPTCYTASVWLLEPQFQ